jgi:hypothetical protein
VSIDDDAIRAAARGDLIGCVASLPARSIPSLQAIATAMPRGHFEVLDTGHIMALQSPELLLPLVRSLLQTIER